MGSIELLAGAGTGLITGFLLKFVWRSRRKLSCMTGMMVAMTAGMLTGLIAGAQAAVWMGGPLWPPTVVGMGVGILTGTLLGASVSLMAVLDGGLSGLMGGMMGAMLGHMAVDKMASIAGFILLAYFLAALALGRIMRQETGASLFTPRPPIIWVLAIGLFTLRLLR